MLYRYKWLLVSLAAIVLIGATTVTYKQNQVKEANLNNQIEQLKEQSKARSDADKQKLQKREIELQQQVRELNEKLQSKAAEKARIAAETAQKAAERTLAQKVVNIAVPTANAATGDVHGSIVKWADAYGVDPNWLLRVAKCESGYNPLAQNKSYYAGGGNPSGVFQFLPQTFSANAARAGIPGANLWDVDSQAHVAAYMFSIGQSRQWACK